jgi:anti-sigma B factor antagonist
MIVTSPAPPFEPTEESLTCEVVPERGSVRIRPIGALDVATSPILAKHLVDLRTAGFRAFVIDLRELRFIDCSGLRLLLRWHAAARADGFELRVVPGAPEIQRLFELTGTLERLPFTDSAAPRR